MTVAPWNSVPEELMAAWRRVFDRTPGDHDVDADCPVCGKHQLHRYYQTGRPIDRVSNGVRFVARGACWEWCSSCRSYEHYTALVPEWWRSGLRVDESKLTALPDALERALEGGTKKM